MSGLFSSPILDVTIGLFFIYLLLSLLCSNINELMAIVMKTRAHQLRQGIENLLCDPDLAEKVLGHQLVKGLGNSGTETGLIWLVGRAVELWTGYDRRGLPSYIPSRTFALALVGTLAPATDRPITKPDLRQAAKEIAEISDDGIRQKINEGLDKIKTNNNEKEKVKDIKDKITSAGNLESILQAIPKKGGSAAEKRVRNLIDNKDNIRATGRALLTLIDTPVANPPAIPDTSGQAELQVVLTNIETWYDNAMGQVSRLYKRQAQVWLFGIAFVISAVLGADTGHIFNALSTNAALRASTIAAASSATASYSKIPVIESTGAITSTNTIPNMVMATTDAANNLDQLHILLGYEHTPWSLSDFSAWGSEFWKKLAGIFVTTFAISFGAPFWFDVLGKLLPQSTPDSKGAKSEK